MLRNRAAQILIGLVVVAGFGMLVVSGFFLKEGSAQGYTECVVRLVGPGFGERAVRLAWESNGVESGRISRNISYRAIDHFDVCDMRILNAHGYDLGLLDGEVVVGEGSVKWGVIIGDMGEELLVVLVESSSDNGRVTFLPIEIVGEYEPDAQRSSLLADCLQQYNNKIYVFRSKE